MLELRSIAPCEPIVIAPDPPDTPIVTVPVEDKLFSIAVVILKVCAPFMLIAADKVLGCSVMPPAVMRAPMDMTSAVIVTVPVPAFIVAPELFVNAPEVAVLQVIVRYLMVPERVIAPVTVHEPPYIVRPYGKPEIVPIVTRPVPADAPMITGLPVEDKLFSIAVVR